MNAPTPVGHRHPFLGQGHWAPMDAGKQRLLDELAGFAPATTQEAKHRERIAAFLRDHPAPFSRASLPGHVTGSGLVVSPELDRVLLLHHRKLDLWLQCGGHVEATDPSVLATALREAGEESGLDHVAQHPAFPGIADVDIHEIPAGGSMPAHLHLDVRYVLQADPSAPLSPPEAEVKDIGWFTWAEVGELGLDGGLSRFLGKLAARAEVRAEF